MEKHPEIVELMEDVSDSPLYSEDLAPVPPEARTWNRWNLTAIWVGMAVCIPTYMLAADMIRKGIDWWAALLIIGIANVIITLPMVLNGHAGVRYGVPFPVLGRASFGTKGVHIVSIMRAVVAAGWFGIQTWIGGQAFYAIWNVLTGSEGVGPDEIDLGKMIGFGLFWLVNVYFIWKGTESIKWLETWSAPILVLMGIALIWWGAANGGGVGTVLEQDKELQKQTATISTIPDENSPFLETKSIFNKANMIEWRVISGTDTLKGIEAKTGLLKLPFDAKSGMGKQILEGEQKVEVKFYRTSKAPDTEPIASSWVKAELKQGENMGPGLWDFVFWLTAMVGFWATMSLSISDITRYAKNQKDQAFGQFVGLPGTMVLYSFVGIFVTCAAISIFEDVLVVADAPWDPVNLLSHFDSVSVVIISQVLMLIATLSTNIAANVIAPANAFSNLNPKKISFRSGGMMTAVLGILICPWWLTSQIAGILIFISALLGPVLGILLCDYYFIRKKKLKLAELYKVKGEYSYSGGFNRAALLALAPGIILAVIGFWVPSLKILYDLSWFTGFGVSFVLYALLMRKQA